MEWWAGGKRKENGRRSTFKYIRPNTRIEFYIQLYIPLRQIREYSRIDE